MIVLFIVAAILLIMGIVVLIGKGDNLIAGYNTASKEEKSQYNIKRLRGLIGGLLIFLAPMMVLLLGEESMTAGWSFLPIPGRRIRKNNAPTVPLNGTVGTLTRPMDALHPEHEKAQSFMAGRISRAGLLTYIELF